MSHTTFPVLGHLVDESALQRIDNGDVQGSVFSLGPEGKEDVSWPIIRIREKTRWLLLGSKNCLSCCLMEGIPHMVALSYPLTPDSTRDVMVPKPVTETHAPRHWTLPLCNVGDTLTAAVGSTVEGFLFW